MNEIIRITIKGESGYGHINEAYQDKITICKDSIRYEYKPMVVSKDNLMSSWSYKTSSSTFYQLFLNAGKAVEKIIDMDHDLRATDIGCTSFVITYSDKTRKMRNFFLPPNDFKQCFSIITQMIPSCEDIPKVIKSLVG